MPDDQATPGVVISPPPEPPQPGAERPRKRSKKKRSGQRQWERIKSWGKIAAAIFAGGPSAVIAIWVLGSLLILTFHRHSLDLDAIGVLETLSKVGFTSKVATQHLRDAIYAVQQRAQTNMALTGVDTDWELSEITIPKTGLSLQSVAVAVRSLLPGWRHEVSGEFVQSGNGISLQLRHNGRVIFSETAKDADPDAADTLLRKDLQGGAFKVVKETQPYVAASALYGDGRSDEQVTAAEKEADQIIASLPATDENVIWAINLKGVIADVRGEYPEAEALLKKLPRFAGARLNLGNVYDHQHKPAMAITEYQAAIWLDPKLASPDANLCNVYDEQHRLEIAIVECQAAIQLDPKSAPSHTNLGRVYHDQHKLEMAIAEDKTAILLNPQLAMPHNNLGKVYDEQAKPEMAIAEFQTAIRLDPRLALPHANLCKVYYDQQKLETAIVECQEAIQLDPKLALPHAHLCKVYDEQHKLEIAMLECQTAIQLDPKDATYHNNLGKVYQDQHKPEMAIAEFQKAIQLDPKSALPHSNLGIVYYDQHKQRWQSPKPERRSSATQSLRHHTTFLGLPFGTPPSRPARTRRGRSGSKMPAGPSWREASSCPMIPTSPLACTTWIR
jgi:tetratricopeptide (TPR) repeat protein